MYYNSNYSCNNIYSIDYSFKIWTRWRDKYAFEVSKISIISTVGAQDVENEKEEWNLNVNQDNDIYIDIQKNEKYKKTETIKNVIIDNINISKQPTKGILKFYKPSKNKDSIFENSQDYESMQISFEGDKSTNIQDLKISNQGGRIAFRCSNENIGTYKSNKDKEVIYSELLEKLDVNNEDLKAAISFDITIELNSGKSFKGTFNIEVPVEDIVSEEKTAVEITDFCNVVFKRIEN